MSWAHSGRTQVGDVIILNRNGKDFALIKATEDGYIELFTGSFIEMRDAYERIHGKEVGSVYVNIETLRSEQGGDFRNNLYDEDGGYDVGDSGKIGSRGLQDNTSTNDENLRTRDKGVSGKREVRRKNSFSVDADTEVRSLRRSCFLCA